MYGNKFYVLTEVNMKNKKQNDLQKLDGSKPPLWLRMLYFFLAFSVSFAAFYLLQYMFR
jgi:hypothetical protein